MSDDRTTTTVPPTGEPAPRRKAGRGGASFFRELPFLVVIALALALLIKAFVLQAFYIPSGSMQQTLELNDRVLVNKVVYRLRDVRRGEVVVFDGEGNFGANDELVVVPPASGLARGVDAVKRIVGVGPPGEKDYIKRVIGVAGDRVACCTDGHVTVQPQGAAAPVVLREPYLYEDDQQAFCAAGTGPQACPAGAPGLPVPAGRLWVMGDHRGASSDSRAHIDDPNHGTVPVDHVIGRALVIVWPLSRSTVLRIPPTFHGPLAAGTTGAPYLLGLGAALPLTVVRRRRRRTGP